MVGKCTGYIQVASTDFIKGSNATGKETSFVWDVKAKALPYKDMCTYTGREAIIALWVPIRFFRPEFITEDCIEVQATR